MAIAEELGLDDRARSDLFFASLLSGIGCTGFAHEMAQFFGDEFPAVRAFSKIDSTRPREAMAAVAAAVRGASPGRRTRVLVNNVHGLGARSTYAARRIVQSAFQKVL